MNRWSSISLAIKFTGEGGTIAVAVDRDDGEAILTVSDSGVGIDPELIPHVFEAFRQSRQRLDRSSGGLGLGLALVKSLVEMQGGRVEARSAGKDRGSEFVVRLPITGKAAPEKCGASVKGDTFKILIVEDNEDAADMLRAVLELSGHEVAVANRAAQGIAMARDMRPEVVLCDIGLPDGMSGVEVAEALRRDPGTAGIILIALTGYGGLAETARCEEAGFDAHLTKPVDTEDILQALNEVKRRRQ